MPEMNDYHFDGSLKDDPKRKFHSLVNKFGPRKMGGLIATLIVAIMLPVTLIAVQQQQNIKQQASETWRKVAELPGNIGRNPYDSNQYFYPTIVEFSSSLHVFVIGEGGPGSGKPGGDWYQLYVSSTDQPSVGWGGYRLLGGNASSNPEVKKEGDTLHVRVRGLTIDGGGNMTPQYDTFYSKRRQLLSDFPEGGNGWEVVSNMSGWGYSNTVTYSRDGKQYRAKTDGGRLIIEVQEFTSGPTSTVTPRPNTPTATPVVSNPSCNVAGCGRTASRCSANFGCTRAYYNPATANSCGDPINGTVTYKKDASCGIITQEQKRQRGFDLNSDALNTPCYSDALTDLQRTYGSTTPICTGNAVLPTATPTFSPLPTGVATPPPGGIIAVCASTQPKSANRCSFNFANARGYFLTRDKACTTTDMAVAKPLAWPEDPKICYITDYSCPTTYQGKQLPARNGKQQCLTTPTPTRTQPTPTRGSYPTPVPGA